MDRAAILACPIMVVGVVMYAAPPNQVSKETPPREGDRIGRCRCWVIFDRSERLWPQVHVRFAPCVDGSELARTFFTYAELVGAPVCSACQAAHMTAGHNALRGSGFDRKPAFDNASGQLGCPDRQIDRLCITCCSSSQPSHHAGYRRS